MRILSDYTELTLPPLTETNSAAWIVFQLTFMAAVILIFVTLAFLFESENRKAVVTAILVFVLGGIAAVCLTERGLDADENAARAETIVDWLDEGYGITVGTEDVEDFARYRNVQPLTVKYQGEYTRITLKPVANNKVIILKADDDAEAGEQLEPIR